uniref:Uncharacterized protein n=1 Tax=Oryza brachyantha TaxID=4533 RepID=J3MB02_ORYBR
MGVSTNNPTKCPIWRASLACLQQWRFGGGGAAGRRVLAAMMMEVLTLVGLHVENPSLFEHFAMHELGR